jgi:hypothetical protein
MAYYFHVHDQFYSKLAVLNLHKICLRCFDFHLIQFILKIIMLSDNDPSIHFYTSFTGFHWACRRPCRSSSDWSLAFHRGSPGSRPGSMWDLWWTKRHWGWFSPSTLVSLVNQSTHFSIIIITRDWHNRHISGRSAEWLVAGFPPRRPGFKLGSGHVGFCDGQKWRWGRFSPRT